MKKISIIASLSILLLLMVLLPNQTPTRASDPTTGRIFGYTYQTIGWSTIPIPFVQVRAGDQQVLSDLAGYYEINNLPLGHVYTVCASKAGFQNTSTQVELTPEYPVAEVDFILSIRADLNKVVVVMFYAKSPSAVR